MKKFAVSLAALVVLTSACTGDAETTTSGPSTTEAAAASDESSDSSAPPPTAATSTTAPTASEAPGPSADDITLPDELQITPRQAEGPYYPATKPGDRDGNLLIVDGGEPTTLGTPLELAGLLVYEDGSPVADATIEIWQVDGQGIYDHPSAPNTENRDPAFQFYGESVTDGEGFWTFLTVDPVVYESRPRHIHAKVKLDGAEVLTTQIYFDGDPLLDEDGLARSAGDGLALLTTNAIPGTLSSGQPGLIARHIIVLASETGTNSG